MRATSPRAAPPQGLVPGSVNSHCCQGLKGRGQQAVPSGPKVLELQQHVLGAGGWGGSPAGGTAAPLPLPRSLQQSPRSSSI